MNLSPLALLLLPGIALAQWSAPDLPAFQEKTPGVFISQGRWRKARSRCA